jgi:hypothetical protein
MKKLSVVLIMLVGGIAFASSLSIPWYVDNAASNTGLPPVAAVNAGMSIIYLKSTILDPVVCYIEYFNENGVSLGPDAPNNTFVIAPQAALGFRPVAADASNSVPAFAGDPNPTRYQYGQEGAAGYAVPNRPRSVDTTTNVPGRTFVDTKKNGSITITWLNAGPTAVQGSQNAYAANLAGSIVSFSHLLPPGAGN